MPAEFFLRNIWLIPLFPLAGAATMFFVGRIIGRNGQTIQSIRALLTSAAARHNQRATIEIVE